jgi:hypothetical protein
VWDASPHKIGDSQIGVESGPETGSKLNRRFTEEDYRSERGPLGAHETGDQRPEKKRATAWIVTARPMTAMDSVSGMSLGQTLTQFWALPQSDTPPGP